MSSVFEMKRFACDRGLFQEVMTQKLRQNANFENGGTTIQIGILRALLNIYQYLYCLEYMKRLAISRCKISSHVILRFEEN